MKLQEGGKSKRKIKLTSKKKEDTIYKKKERKKNANKIELYNNK